MKAVATAISTLYFSSFTKAIPTNDYSALPTKFIEMTCGSPPCGPQETKIKRRKHRSANEMHPMIFSDEDVGQIYFSEEKAFTTKLTERINPEADLSQIKQHKYEKHNLRKRGVWNGYWRDFMNAFNSVLPMFGVEIGKEVTLYSPNLFYYIGLHGFGSNKEPAFLIWDTGSEWTVIESYLCETCEGLTYDYSDELGGSFNPIADSSGIRAYGSAYLEGFEARDTFCLNPESEL